MNAEDRPGRHIDLAMREINDAERLKQGEEFSAEEIERAADMLLEAYPQIFPKVEIKQEDLLADTHKDRTVWSSANPVAYSITGRISETLLKEQVELVLAGLTDRERKVFKLRFGLEDGRFQTLVEVGQEIGRSRYTAGRIERSALAKLSLATRTKTLDDYLG